MYRFVTMLMLCLAVRSTSSKSLFEFNVNPEYDLQAEESRSYSNFWPGAEFDSSSQIRDKHYATPHGPHWRGEPGFGGPRHPHHHPGPHHFPQSSEEYDDDTFYDFPPHHQKKQHRIPPGHGKKHRHHGYHGHPHDLPRRFPPPPVYDVAFINPWATTPQPLTVPQQPLTTPGVIKPPIWTTTSTSTTTTTTPAPISTTTTEDDQLTFDIDVRFGRD